MTADIAEYLSALAGGNQYLTLFLVSMCPLLELRGAIILMGGMEGIYVFAGMLCCVAGGSVVILPMILAIRPIIKWLKRSGRLERLGNALEIHLSDRAESVESKSGRGASTDCKRFWGLLTFVAVPLPMTGAWTGSAIGGVLDIPVWKACLAVFFGNFVAAGILTALVTFTPVQYLDFYLGAFVIFALAVVLSYYIAAARKKQTIAPLRMDRHSRLRVKHK